MEIRRCKWSSRSPDGGLAAPSPGRVDPSGTPAADGTADGVSQELVGERSWRSRAGRPAVGPGAGLLRGDGAESSGQPGPRLRLTTRKGGRAAVRCFTWRAVDRDGTGKADAGLRHQEIRSGGATVPRGVWVGKERHWRPLH